MPQYTYTQLFKYIDPNLKFNIRIIPNQRDGNPAMSINTDTLDPNKYQNTRRNVFFRPNNRHFVLVDIDHYTGPAQIQSLKDHNAFLILETSHKHYQAWFYFNKIDDANDYYIISNLLARKFGGDHGSAKDKQVGRVPYTKNRKPGRNDFQVKEIYRNTKQKKITKQSNTSTLPHLMLPKTKQKVSYKTSLPKLKLTQDEIDDACESYDRSRSGRSRSRAPSRSPSSSQQSQSTPRNQPEAEQNDSNQDRDRGDEEVEYEWQFANTVYENDSNKPFDEYIAIIMSQTNATHSQAVSTMQHVIHYQTS